jgi:hypothetical protein
MLCYYMYIPFSQDWTIFELYISSSGKKQQSYFAKKLCHLTEETSVQSLSKKVCITNKVFLLFLLQSICINH